MPRKPSAFYDKRAGCWASSALGEMKATKAGKVYRAKVFNRGLTHPTRDRLAAQAWVHEGLEARRGKLAAATDPTYDQVVEWYLQEAEKQLCPEAYGRTIEHLERFGNWPGPEDPQRMDLRIARTIGREEVEAYRDALVAAGRAPSYITNALLKSLKACFRWAAAVRPGRLPGLPIPYALEGLKCPALPRRPHRDIDPVKVSRFLRWAWRRAVELGEGPRGRHARSRVILLMTLRDTGARPKELCVAEWDEWKLMPDGWGLIRLPAWKWKNGRKTGEDRLIAVPPHCARRIEQIRAAEGRHPTRIFTHPNTGGRYTMEGVPWVWIDHERKRSGGSQPLQQSFVTLRRDGQRAGYPLPEGFRLYFNRSAYSTRARRRGVNDVTLAKAMGTSVAMLDRHYTDHDESDVLHVAREALEAGSMPRATAPDAVGPRGGPAGGPGAGRGGR